MALATIPVVVERGVLIREFAAKITRKRLRYLLECPQGPEPDASGYKGFFYHFLDIETGRRVWQCELSTIDSAFLFAGALTVATYFDRDTADEVEIRRLADALYRRADWNWARDGGPTLTHGWRPESGFIPHRWQGYDEGLLLYILGLGSPTHPLPPESYRRLLRDLPVEEDLRSRIALLGAALHASALAHVDRLSRHSRRLHARARQRLLREQPAGDVRAAGVRDPQSDGLRRATASTAGGSRPATAPAGCKRVVDGVEREFFDYIARGAPFGPDDGTVAPWVVVASLPFAPEIVIPTVRHFARMDLGMTARYGFKPSFNQIVRGGGQPDRLVGHAVSLRDRSGAGRADDRELPHRPALEHHAPVRPVLTGLRRAGFTGGWL